MAVSSLVSWPMYCASSVFIFSVRSSSLGRNCFSEIGTAEAARIWNVRVQASEGRKVDGWQVLPLHNRGTRAREKS